MSKYTADSTRENRKGKKEILLKLEETKPTNKVQGTGEHKAKKMVPIRKKTNWAFSCGCIGCGGIALIIILIIVAVLSFIIFGGKDQLGISINPFG